MKKLLFCISTIVFLLFSNTSFGQTPNGTLNLGILESFEGFTGALAISMVGTSWRGDAGTNDGGISGLDSAPTFIGNKYAANPSLPSPITTQARFDLFRFYIHLNSLFIDYPDTHSAVFANETITPGVYFVTGAGNLGGTLTLDGTTNGIPNPDAFFVIKCSGALTVDADTKVILTGGTKSCNVFFVADGSMDLAARANIKGTLFSKGGAIGLGAGAELEGRMLTLSGAIAVGAACKVYPPADLCTIPINCETECSPAASVDVLGSVSNYALFTNSGAVSNTAVTGIDGNIGAASGSYTGYESSIVVGEYHVADASTIQAKIDLDNAYNDLMALSNTVPSPDGVTPIISAHSPVLGSLVVNGIGGETLYPGVYNMTGIGTLQHTLKLDAQGDPDAIFIFKFSLAFNVSAAAKTILLNGARRCNVFFIAGAGPGNVGAIAIGANAHLQGTFLAHCMSSN